MSGQRLRPEALAVKINEQSIWDISGKSIRSCSQFFSDLVLVEREQTIARDILKEIKARLRFLVNVGLDYLTAFWKGKQGLYLVVKHNAFGLRPR